MSEENNFKTKVFGSLGQASMAWSETPKGTFNSTLCNELGESIIKEYERDCIKGYCSGCNNSIPILSGIYKMYCQKYKFHKSNYGYCDEFEASK